MSTYVNGLVRSLPSAWAEVDRLLEAAGEAEKQDPLLYSALCRVITVLLVSQIEYFVKQIADAYVGDVNSFSTFADSPLAMKRTFCQPYLSGLSDKEKEVESRTQLLIATFEALETRFVPSSFLKDGPEGTKNNNPSPSVIAKLCSNFGVKNVFGWFTESMLDSVFEDRISEIDALLDDLNNHLLESTAEYPYKTDPSRFKISAPKDQPGRGPSLWTDFLDDILRARHAIVHGSELTNRASVHELRVVRKKILVLQCGVLVVLCHHLTAVS